MPRYIDADKLLNTLPDDLPYKASVKRVLIQAPAADVVEVVRCKDCILYKPNYLPGLRKYDNCGICTRYKFLSEEYNFRVETDFCSYGAQKERGGEK